MTFWSFLGEFAVFNMICDLFSGKSRHQYQQPAVNQYDYTHDADYESRMEELNQKISDAENRILECQAILDNSRLGDTDGYVGEIQDRIDELESKLDDCDIMSDRYDRIQEEIDMLQDRLDDIEDKEDMYDDLNDELDDLYDDLDDLELELDEFEEEDDW